MDAGVVDKYNYFKQFRMPLIHKKKSVATRVRRFPLKFFSVLSETAFAYIVPVSNLYENERRPLEFGSKRNGFDHSFRLLNENENEQRTLMAMVIDPPIMLTVHGITGKKGGIK
jgi:hypothetical protein